MPVPGYSVLKGDPQRGEVAFDRNGQNPHYRIYMQSGLQVDVNIESRDQSEVLYAINNSFAPPNPGLLDELDMGTTPLDSAPGGLALDYVREQIGSRFMIQQSDMTLLPIASGIPRDELKNAVIKLLDQACADPQGLIYAFGSAYSDPNGNGGIHNIHMNQGNPEGGFSTDNGIWRDGALFIHLPANGRWIALFIAFQTQSWRTDGNGDPA